jgi:uncharacterized membrane protein YraQ (UPF0718 family)
MFLLFGLGAGRSGRILFAARIALVVAFILTVAVFHPHGTALDILQVVRFALLIALVGSGVWMRRRQRSAPVGD